MSICTTSCVFPLYENINTLSLSPKSLHLLGFFTQFVEYYQLYSESGIIHSVFVILLTIFYHRLYFHGFIFSRSTFFLSTIFTFFVLIGRAYSSSVGSLRYFTQNTASIVQTIIWIIGYLSLIYAVLVCIEDKLRKFCLANDSVVHSNICTLQERFNYKFFYRNIGIMLVCWLPYYLICLPGSTEFDIMYATKNYIVDNSPGNAVPFLLTFLFSKILLLGKFLFGKENAGLLTCSTLQMIAYAFLFSYSIEVLRKKGVPNKICSTILLAYCTIPLFPTYAITIGKDCAYGFMMTLASIYFFQIIDDYSYSSESSKFFTKNNTVALSICLILLSLFRHAGILIVLISLLILAYILRKTNKAKIALILCLFATSVTIIWDNIILPALHVKRVPDGMMMSILFQQTARATKESNLEAWEIEAINKVLDYSSLSKLYEPEISDPVMATYKQDTSMQDKANYYKAWAYRFWRSPMSYIEAVLHKSYGYFDPNYSFKFKLKPIVFVGIHGPTDHIKALNFNSWHPRLIFLLSVALHGLSNIPFLGMLVRCGTYAWILLFSIYFLLKYGRKQNYIIAFIPSILVLIGCVASPVNAYMRYMIPLVFSCPFLVGVSFCNIDNALLCLIDSR